MDLTSVADWLGENLMEVHRGVRVENNKVVLFGNDSIRDPMVVHEIELILEGLRKRGLGLDGIGSNGFTWVMVVNPRKSNVEIDDLEELLWESAKKAFGVKNAYQRMI